ncbi:hypothetical protein [Methylobacterium nodulans]|uniref:Uncharacterized protein n=1 Tax=Methylobacterium nodulans (strain LMG 21967 / CNCM I-2342 / ORS 2060) TaxID=460265 RepID=B8IBI3_METNO|nr:hypothetical protein [Methylobacterium nodulans]ACL57398.1 hypothetical protein Mnod_2427 [Methylobacterium nodulans ORS 2060]
MLQAPNTLADLDRLITLVGQEREEEIRQVACLRPDSPELAEAKRGLAILTQTLAALHRYRLALEGLLNRQ